MSFHLNILNLKSCLLHNKLHGLYHKYTGLVDAMYVMDLKCTFIIFKNIYIKLK